MKTVRGLHLLGGLAVLLVAAVFFTPAAEAQPRIHALLIINGANNNPRDHSRGGFIMYKLLEESVKKNLGSDVRIDILKSPTSLQLPINPNATLDIINGYSRKLSDAAPITADNILRWVNNVSPARDDIVFVYFTGHGGTYKADRTYSGDVGNEGEFFLQLPGVVINRGRLVEAMDRLGCRLKILLTDACSYGVEVEPFNLNPPDLKEFYKNLFFQHKGFLNVVAASPGEYATSTPEAGGLFTAAFVFTMTVPPESVWEDGFSTWEEVFRETYEMTQWYFQRAYSDGVPPQLNNITQTSQHPKYLGALPRPIQ